MTRSKYGNKRTKIDGITFASKAEANRYLILKSREQAGEIQDLHCHPRFVIQESFWNEGNHVRAITYEADFEYYLPDGVQVVEDVKGVETKVFKIKAKMFKKHYGHIKFRTIPA